MRRIERKLNNIHCIYAIKCLENNKCYIGQTKNAYRRLREHERDLRENRSHNPLLQADYNKYGNDAFDYEILFVTDTDDLDEKEKDYIEAYRKSDSCYNIFGGGLTRFSVTDEFREKTSQRFLGTHASEETKKKRSENTKKQWKECTGYAEKMAENARNQWKDKAFREKVISANIGKRVPSMCKMSKEDVLEARRRFANGEKISALAKEHGVKYDAMYKAVHKVTWRDI